MPRQKLTSKPMKLGTPASRGHRGTRPGTGAVKKGTSIIQNKHVQLWEQRDLNETEETVPHRKSINPTSAARMAESNVKKNGSFEKGIQRPLEALKRLATTLNQDAAPAALETFEHAVKAAFARAIGAAIPDFDHQQRIKHFAGRTKWVDSKMENPSITPLEHIEAVYPDRRQFMLARCDLLDSRMDPQLYQALSDWLRPKSDGSKNVIPPDFDLPRKSERTEKIAALSATLSATTDAAMRAKDAMRVRKIRKRKLLQLDS